MSGYEGTFVFNFTEANTTNGTGNGTGSPVYPSIRTASTFVILLCLGALTILLCGLICTIQVRTQELHKVTSFVMLNSLIADLVSGVGSIMLINMAYRTFDYTTGNDALCKRLLYLFSLADGQHGLFFSSLSTATTLL